MAEPINLDELLTKSDSIEEKAETPNPESVDNADSIAEGEGVDDSIKNNGLKQILEQIPEIINSKHHNFINKDDVKNHVKHYMGIIFTSKKEDSIKILNNLKNTENDNEINNQSILNINENIENRDNLNEEIFM
jgi:hypothetical protein